MNKRLVEIVNIGLDYYSKDPRNEFNGISPLNIKYTRKQRLGFIEALVEEIEKFPLTDDMGGKVLHTDNMSMEQRRLLRYITLDLNAKTLRGTLTGHKLKTKDLPYINNGIL